MSELRQPPASESLDEVIAAYLRAVDSQGPQQEEDWFQRYPRFKADLAEFFSDHDQLKQAIAPTREKAGNSRVGQASPSTIEHVAVPLGVAANRYAIGAFLARGGMGEVWLAADERIGRQVAFKRLRPKRESQRERFLTEAQITGQLEHPSIVPLHDLGVDDQGQPFYIMKYVQGTTLKEAIAEYHAADSASDTPHEVLRLRLLEVFLALCHAVQFAHSRGVLHRDLKPDNVMLGRFGETVLLDWGLAKVKAEPPGPERAGYVTLGSVSGSAETQDGSVIGSPAYMAPEVAEGRLHDVDERTDVYLLGATLYEILTGRAPRQGASMDEMIELARTVDPPRPRTLAPVPWPLEAICLKALSRRPQGRYSSAAALAEDVQRFLAGEPTSAYPEPWSRRTLRWCKKRQRGLKRVALAAALVAGAGLIWSARQEVQHMRNIEQAKTDIASFRRRADEVWFYAAHRDAPGERATYYDPQQAQVSGRAALELADAWGPALERLPLADSRPAIQRDLYELILLLVQERLADRAQEDGQEPLALLEKAEALATPTKSFYRLQAECYESAGNASQAAKAQRGMDDPRTATTALDHFLQAETLRRELFSPANPHLDQQTRAASSALAQRAMDQYRQVLEQEPQHFWAHLQLGRLYLALGRSEEAVQILGTCVALQPESPWGYSARAAALIQIGSYALAQQELTRLLDKYPDFLPARLNLGRSFQLNGKLDAALAEYAQVLQAPEDRRLITAAYYRGEVFLQQNKLDDAMAEFRRVVSDEPGFYPVYLVRAQAQFAQGADELALADLDHFLFLTSRQSLNTNDWQLHHLRGAFLRRLYARLPESVPLRRAAVLGLMLQELRTAVTLGGRSAELFDDLGAAFDLDRQPLEAARQYSAGLDLPDAPSELRTRLLLKRGWNAAGQGNLAAAEKDFRQVLEIQPPSAEAHTGLGYIQALRMQRAAAEKSALESLLSPGQDYLVLQNVACIYATLSASGAAEDQHYQELAMAVLKRELSRWRELGRPAPNALDLIRAEEALKPLRVRDDFRDLLDKE